MDLYSNVTARAIVAKALHARAWLLWSVVLSLLSFREHFKNQLLSEFTISLISRLFDDNKKEYINFHNLSSFIDLHSMISHNANEFHQTFMAVFHFVYFKCQIYYLHWFNISDEDSNNS